MNIKSLILGLFAAILFISCDDDLNTVGSNIQPGGDDILVETDTFFIKARTVPLDSIYAWSTNPLLGKYEDDIFGTIRADFLCEFNRPDSVQFLGEDVKIDSVMISVTFIEYSGDTLAPMGLAAYELNSQLTNNFYTNVNPADYCDMSKVLGTGSYTIASATKYTSNDIIMRTVRAIIPKSLGERFYQESLRPNNVFEDSNPDRFKEFFPGVYLTNSLGSGSLIEVYSTSLDIYYNYNDVKGNHDNTQDTIRTGLLFFAVTPEVIQLNHIENSVPSDLLQEGTGELYIKSPAGVCVEVELPVLEILNSIGNDKTKSINSANFAFKGYTEKEEALKNNMMNYPDYLLFIDKDSIDSFFKNKKLIDYKTSTYIQRNSTTNTYNLGNLASIIMEYKNRENLSQNPKFVLMPVNISITSSSSGSTINRIYNYMKPLTAILRGDQTEDMKMGIIYSKY